MTIKKKTYYGTVKISKAERVCKIKCVSNKKTYALFKCDKIKKEVEK